MIFAHNVDQFERLAVGLSRQVLATGIRTPDLPHTTRTFYCSIRVEYRNEVLDKFGYLQYKKLRKLESF